MNDQAAFVAHLDIENDRHAGLRVIVGSDALRPTMSWGLAPMSFLCRFGDDAPHSMAIDA
ncbi:hypothetical protein D3C80_1745370 [compost metagenome]